MSGSGRWTLQERMRRCSGERECRTCQADASVKPHGPYYTLRRRHPETGEQEAVYVGTTYIPDDVLDRINALHTGPVAPSKDDVLALLGSFEEKTRQGS